MSLLNQGKPSRMRSVYGHNSGTTTEVVYTCPANCVAEITFIHIVNGGGSTNSVDLEWYVAADTYTSHFLAGKSLGAGDYITFKDIDLALARVSTLFVELDIVKGPNVELACV